MRVAEQIIRAALLLAWMAVIYLFSDQPNSNEITENVFGSFNYFVRKGAHMAEFGILFYLALAFQRSFQKQPRRFHTGKFITTGKEKNHSKSLRAGVLLRQHAAPILFAIFYACTDEWHQAFVPGRSAVVSDVFIDSLGVFITSLAIGMFARI